MSPRMTLNDAAPSRVLVLGLLWIAYLLNYVDRQMAFTWFPVLRHDVGFSDAQLGLIGTVFLWSYSACAPFGGRIGDRFPRRAILMASVAGWSVATMATGLSSTPSIFLFWRAVVGVTEGFYFPTAVSTLVSVFGSALRGRAIAMHGMAQFAGIALGGWLGGYVASMGQWRAACLALGGFGLVYSVALAGGLRGLPVPQLEHRSQSAGGENVRMPLCLAAIGGCFFLMCAMLWMIYAWLPDAIHNRLGLDLESSGRDATLTLQLSSMAGLLSGGAVGDWGTRRWTPARGYLMALGLLLAAPFAWLCFAADSVAVLRFAECGFGLFSSIMLSNVIASAYDLVPASRYGFTAGWITLVGGLGGGLSTLAAGAWLTRIPHEVLMYRMALASAIAAVILALLAGTRFTAEAR
jgi:MFS family permease